MQVLENATGFCCRLRMAERSQIRHPFLDYVVDTVAVREIFANGRCSERAVGFRAECGKCALPSIGCELAFRLQVIASGGLGFMEAAACRYSVLHLFGITELALSLCFYAWLSPKKRFSLFGRHALVPTLPWSENPSGPIPYRPSHPSRRHRQRDADFPANVIAPAIGVSISRRT